MKKYLLLFLFVLPCYSQEFQESGISIPVPVGGLKNDIDASSIGEKHTSDGHNILYDVSGGVTRRTGSLTYDNTQFSSDTIRVEHSWFKEDGTKYMMQIISSTMRYTTGDGNWTVLISTLSTSYDGVFCDWLDKSWYSNGYDPVYYFDGTYLRASTETPRGRYMSIYQDRMWVSGVTSERSLAYYSGLNDWQTPYEYEYIGQDDGDIITALGVSNGVLCAFKNYSIFGVIWKYVYGVDQPLEFIIRNITKEYGCLYNTSISQFRGGSVFFARQGVVEMQNDNQGNAQFKVRSKNIQGDLKNFAQTGSYTSEWTETSALDFGDGSMVNVDTKTYSGSITLKPNNNKINQANFGSNEVIYAAGYPVTTPGSSYQTFQTSYTLLLTTVSVYGAFGTAGYNLTMSIGTSTATFATHVLYSAGPTVRQWFPVNFSTWTTILTSGTTYRIDWSWSGGKFSDNYSTGNEYSRGEAEGGYDADFSFRIYQLHYGTNQYAQYQSQVYNAGSFTKQWGIFTVDSNLPTGTNITYYVSCATASVLCSSNSITLVTNNDEINSTALPYIMWFASITTSNIGVSPEIKSITMTYHTSEYRSPICATTYTDQFGITRYYIAFTSPTFTYNNLIYAANEDWVWTKFDGINAYSMCVYNDKLYVGSSKSDGWTYRLDVPGVYDDSGVAYTSDLVTADFNAGYPDNEKQFTRVHVRAKNTGDWSLYWGYGLDGEGATSVTIPVDLDQRVGIFSDRANLPSGTKAYSIKLQLSMNTTGQYFDWRGANCYWRSPVEMEQ